MSSYWSAISGTVLLLSSTETDDFLQSYLSKTYTPDATFDDVKNMLERISEQGYDESYLLKSKSRKEAIKTLPTLDSTFNLDLETIRKVKGSIFTIDEYDEDEYSGGMFYPISKLNNKEQTYTNVENNSVLIYSSKSTNPLNILSNKSYKSLDELIQDYKDTVGDYLPDDFDWDSHIGFFQCAVYA